MERRSCSLDDIENLAIETVTNLSKNRDFLNDKQKLLEGLKQRLETADTPFEVEQFKKQKQTVQEQIDQLLENIGLIKIS